MGQFSVLSDSERMMKVSIDSDIRTQAMNMMKLRSLARPIASFGKKRGQTVEIEKYQKLAKATDEINELRSLPIQRSTINFVQVTVKEYGSGTSWTKRTDDLAEYAVDEQLKQLLAINMAESMDDIAGTEFKNSDVFYTPTSASAGTLDKDGTVSTSAGADFTMAHHRDIIKNMKNDNVPKFDGNNYLAVLHVFTLHQLFEDTNTGGFVDIHKYDQPETLINGEVGALFGARLVEENNVFSGTIGGSSNNGDGVYLGFDAVVEALAEPEHTEFESSDFNRFHAIAWVALTGFKKVWKNSDDSQYSIVYLHSND